MTIPVTSTTCTTRTCIITYDYMHVRTLHYATNYAVFNMIGRRYNQIEYINTKIKITLVQNYGWPTGPAKIWLWLARRPFGWPRATGPAGSTTPASIMR